MLMKSSAAGLPSELHDDFSQRLALLSLGLEVAAENITRLSAGSQPANERAHQFGK